MCKQQVQHIAAESHPEFISVGIHDLQGQEVSSSKTCLTSYRSGNFGMFGFMWNQGLVVWGRGAAREQLK